MTVTTPAYATREETQAGIDFRDGITTEVQRKTDRAIQSASRLIEGDLHFLFYPWDGTRWQDFPNYQWVSPWETYTAAADGKGGATGGLQCLTAFASGGVSIGLDQCFLRPPNKRPGRPYTKIELDRSSGATFGGNAATPQNAIMMQGTWGFTAEADPAGTITASLTDSATTVLISDASQLGVGDVAIIGYGRGDAPFPDDTLGHAGLIRPYVGERVLVQDRQANDTGLAQSGSGCTTNINTDNVLAWTGSGVAPSQGEVLLLDTEQMLVLQSFASTAIVQRAWNGTAIATHTGAEIWAYRSLTVERGALGTTAQSWDANQAIYRHRVPSPVKDLAIALAIDRGLQETSGYARTFGSGDASRPAPGAALPRLWAAARAECGRQLRMSTV